MIVDYLREFGKTNRAAIRDLLFDKFPDTLSPSQKEWKVLTLLTALKRKGVITTDSDSRKIANWILVQGNKNNQANVWIGLEVGLMLLRKEDMRCIGHDLVDG